MKMDKEMVKRFIDLLEDLAMSQGGTVRSYSGRGMFGRYCVGFVCDEYTNPFDLGVALGEMASDSTYGIEVCELPSAAMDSLGRSTIIYWPRAEWPEGREDSDDDE